MKKLLTILSFLFIAFSSYAQDVIGGRIIAKNSLFVRDRWVDTITVDTSNFLNYNRSIPTAGAVYEFVNARMGGGGGSGTLTNITGVNTNGFAWSIANPTTTPALTLSTNQTGLLYGNGTSMTGTALGYDFLRSGDSLKIRDWVNIVDFGAVGDGTTDATTAVQNAVSTGKDVFVPEGVFLISGSANTTVINLSIGQKIFGINRFKSILKTSSQIRLLHLEDFCSVADLGFLGSGSKTSAVTYQAGVFVSTSDTAFSITNCYFKNIGGSNAYVGGAIEVRAIETTYQIGGVINNNIIENCYIGLSLYARAEYLNISNNKFTNTHVAVWNSAGNTAVVNNTFQSCDTAHIVFGGTNNGHCISSANTYNHNTVNLVVDGVTNGYTFNGDMLYAGNVVIRNSDGIKFYGDFSSGTITLTNNTNLYRAGRWLSMTKVLVSGEDFNVLGETKTGSSAIAWIDQYSTIDTVRFRGPTILRSLAGSGSGFVAVDNNGLLSWSAGAGGDVTKVGTPVNNQLGVWTGNGTIEGDANLTFASSTLSIGVAGSSTGILTLSGTTSGTISLQPASAAGTYTLTLPVDDGTSNQFLQTNGSGVLTWATPSGSGDVLKVGTPVNNQLGVWTGDGTIEGDANLTFASSTLNIGVAGASTGILTQSGVTSGTITFQPASAAGTYTLTWPTNDGDANQVLTTNGSGVLSWTTPSSGSAGQPYLITHTSGTTWTTPSDITTATRFKITMVGGGGGGGGNNTANGKGGGGAAGGALVVYVTGLDPSTGYTMAIGAAGVGGDGTPSNGTAGGNTTLTIGATTYTCNGGNPGQSGGGGGTGGTATNGDINIQGQSGGNGPGTASGAVAGTAGGSSGFGLGMGGNPTASGTGKAATGYGSGGGGSVGVSSTGGAGAQGIIIIEYIN